MGWSGSPCGRRTPRKAARALTWTAVSATPRSCVSAITCTRWRIRPPRRSSRPHRRTPARANGAPQGRGANKTRRPRMGPPRLAWGDRLDEERRQHKRDCGEQLDQHMKRRAGGVLEGVAHRIAHDAGLVRFGTLAEHIAGRVLKPTGLDELLGVVPGAAAVVQHVRHEDTG